MQKPISILIVDDDMVDRTAVRRLLRSSGLDIVLVEAEDSASGLAALRQGAFDCILLDYQLPDADGLSVLRSLRAVGVKLPIIVMTGQGDEQTAVEIMKAGATDYLAKGKLSAEILASSVRYALRVHRAEAERIRTEERLSFLAELSQLLGASLDYEATLNSLALSAVPRFADWCAIDVMQPEGQVRRLSVATGAAPGLLLAAEAQPVRALESPTSYGSARVLKSGTTEYYPEAPPDVLAALAKLPVAERPNITGPISFVCVPLIVRDRALGAITFVRGQVERRYELDDVAFAEEVARRTALAVDNALLYREARDALHARDAFLSIAAHELKTPLTSLLGYVNLLQRRLGALTIAERDRRALGVVADQARRLNRMVASLLDLSRLQTGQFSIESRIVDIGGLVRRVVEEMRLILDQHSLLLELPAEPLAVVGDELRLEQVLLNLLQNAIKYSPNGGAIVVRLAQAGAEVQISVCDQGVGIPPEALPRVFWRFYRAPNTEPQQISGMGVGLYVVKEIVDLHGGQVSVESSEGVGSVFTIRLPSAAPAQIAASLAVNSLGQ